MEIYHLTGAMPFCANSFLVVSRQGGAVVIDPAAPEEEYADALEQTGAQLKLLLCTHGHMDHVGSAEALRRRWGVPLRCAAADIQGSELYPLTGADGSLADGEELTVDELTFRIIATPGHSEGSVCILCGDYLFTGDTLFHGDTGRTDLAGGDPARMVQSIRKLRALRLPPETKVLPGHEEFTTYGEEMAGNWFVRHVCPEEA